MSSARRVGVASVGPGEDVAHFDEAAAEAGLDGAQREAGLDDNLRVGHPLVEVEGENALGVLGQLLERLADVLGFAAEGGGGFDDAVGERFGVGQGFEDGWRLSLRAQSMARRRASMPMKVHSVAMAGS